jgi:mRNA-degrading endonuclease RelE of RelBE toxin-antitoxin system
MEIRFSSRARREFADLSPELKAQARKQLTLLLHDLRHPSLQAKKYGGKDDIWQGRVNRDYRFYFQIIGDAYYVVTIIPHPK